MKLTLSLTGSAAAIAAAMTAFEEVENCDPNPVPTLGNAPAATDTGAGTAAPMPLPLPQSGVVPIPIAPAPNMMPLPTTTLIGPDDGEDEGGEASDGTGLDAEGMPWDERIHASTKTKSAKGVWTKRRGAPKGADLAAIEAQLRGGPLPTPVPMAMQPVPVPMPMAAPEPAPQPPVPMPMAAPTPAPLPMPTAEVAPEPAATEQQWDFASFMQAVGPKMGEGAGKIDPAYLTMVCAHYGLGSITDLAPKPEMIATIIAQFQADGRW